MNILPNYTPIRTTNFVQFYSEGILPAEIKGIVVHYDGWNNKYTIECAFPSDTLVGGHYYDVAEVDSDDFEVINE